MAAGGGGGVGKRPCKDDMYPQVRLLVQSRMVEQIVKIFGGDKKNIPKKVHSLVADFEDVAFRTAQSKELYTRMIAMRVRSLERQRNMQMAAVAAAEYRKQQVQMPHQQQLGNNPVQQGSDSLLTATPQAEPAMDAPVRPPSGQPNRHITGPYMQNGQQSNNNMMPMVNRQNFNSQLAAPAPAASGGGVQQSGQQQIVPSIPMQCQNRGQAQLQPQQTTRANYTHPARIAQLQGQRPVVRPRNAQPNNHLLNGNASGGMYGVRPQPALFMQNQQGSGVNQQHLTNPQWQHQMVQPNNNVAKLNTTGYPGGLNSLQNVGGTDALNSQQNVFEQEALNKMHTNVESQPINPECGQDTLNQQGNLNCPSPQTTETVSGNEAVDWREDTFQKIQSWKAAYFPELMELYRLCPVLQRRTEEQIRAWPKGVAEAYKHKAKTKRQITSALNFLRLQKCQIPENCRENLAMYESAIRNLVDEHKKMKARIKDGNIRKKSQDLHGNPQTIDLTDDAAPLNGGRQSVQKNNSEQPAAGASISETRQNVVVTAPSAQQGISDPQGGVRSPCVSTESPAGGLPCSPTDDVGVCRTPPPVSESGAVQLASRCGSPQHSALQRPILEPGVVAASASASASALAVNVSSPRSPVKTTLPPNVVESEAVVVPVVSPCDESPKPSTSAPDNVNNNCHQQAAPSELTTALPASLSSAQTEANQTEEEACPGAETPPPEAKKTTDRLLDAMRASSPAELPSSVNHIEEALAAMDSVPLAALGDDGCNDKVKRAYDVTSTCSEGAAFFGEEHDAKRQKTKNAVNEDLLGEIGDIDSALIDTAVSIFRGEEHGIPISFDDGSILIQLSYTGASLPPRQKARVAAAVGSHPLTVAPVMLFVPADYPASSPTIACIHEDEPQWKRSTMVSAEVHEEFERALGVLPELRSLKDAVGAWDACVREAVTGFLELDSVGGAPASRFGGR